MTAESQKLQALDLLKVVENYLIGQALIRGSATEPLDVLRRAMRIVAAEETAANEAIRGLRPCNACNAEYVRNELQDALKAAADG